jgi:hypothetical protein
MLRPDHGHAHGWLENRLCLIELFHINPNPATNKLLVNLKMGPDMISVMYDT